MGPRDGPLHNDDPPSSLGGTLAEPTIRRREAALAGHRDDADTARTYLADPDPTVRATALRALDRLGQLDVAEIDRFADDPEPSVRRAVAEIVGRIDLDRRGGHRDIAGPVLERLLVDGDATVVEMAAWAAGESQAGAHHISRLCALAVDHDDALVREAAVAALGALGDAAGLPTILAATHDKATVRRRAIIALAPFDGPEVDAALEQAKSDRDWQVRQAAEDLTSPT